MSISGARGAGRSRAQGRKTAHKKTACQRELTTKRRGELSELAFVYKAAAQGFAVAKPYGDSERYDCILDNGHRLWRIQIKSTTCLHDGLYQLSTCRHTRGGAVPYQAHEIDFLAAHVVPEDSWFLIPISAIRDRLGILLAPRNRPKASGSHGEFREAWHLLRNTSEVPNLSK